MSCSIRSGLLLLGSMVPLAAGAATFTVTTVADTRDGRCDADCSLREAIDAANRDTLRDVIVLGAATYRLTRVTPLPPEQDDNTVVDEEDNEHGDFDLRTPMLIRGRAGLTAIDAGGVSRVFEIHPGANVEFRDLEIRRGYERVRGAGIDNAGSAKLLRVRMRLNQAASAFNLGQGGAVANRGTLLIEQSQFRDNIAAGGEASSGEGGAIWNQGRLTVRDTLFTRNLTRDDNDIGGGGALMNRGGQVSIDRAFFQHNATGQNGYGGAIANRSGGRMRITNSTISGNTSGEPIVGGGAVANGTRSGDAGALTLNYVTIADNDGGGLFNAAYDMVYADSIIAGNYEDYGGTERNYAAGNNCEHLVWPQSGAGSIVGLDGSNCRALHYVDNTTALATVLHALGNNGGFAPTHALRNFAPALDGSSQSLGACPATDQRGAARPFDADADGYALCDVGAFERSADD